MLIATPSEFAGATPLYHINEVNRCPDCGESQWWVGRTVAECACCSSAIALADYRRIRLPVHAGLA